MRFLIASIAWILMLSGAAQPNVVFILTDDLGYGELGAYGSSDVKTPHIDELAKQGLMMTRAYANSTVCSPSRASILFGEYPDLLGVPGVIRDVPYNSWGNLRDDAVSIASNFKKEGYQTALIGKWHLGYKSPDLPNDRGFDYFKGFVGDMMDDYYTHLRHGINWMRENEKVIDSEGHATDLFTAWANNYIMKRTERSTPFFLFLAYNAPHDPVQPPQEYLELVQSRLPHETLKRQKIVALIEHLDENVGQVIATLKRQGLYDNTIIVFTSDNGGALGYGANNAPFNGGKGDMLEGGIRVPCILTWKGQIPPSIYAQPFLLMDFYDLLPQLSEGSMQLNDLIAHQGRDMFWVRREGHRFGGLAYYAVSDGQYKLLQNSPFEPFQLYNVAKDSTEKTPILDKEIEKQLLKKLTEHIQGSGSVPWQ